MTELSVVLPVYNEEDIIAPAVAEVTEVLQHAGIDYELLLVENGSRDGSLAVLQQLAKADTRIRVLVAPSKGYGLAVVYGLGACRSPHVAYMPSDGQIDPRLLPVGLAAVRAGIADIAKGWRTVRENALRKYNSLAYNRLARLLFGIRTPDINGCPKVFSRELVPLLDLKSRDSFLDVELMRKARYLGLSFQEIPSPSRDRIGGRSTTSLRTVAEFLRNMVCYRFGPDFGEWTRGAATTRSPVVRRT